MPSPVRSFGIVPFTLYRRFLNKDSLFVYNNLTDNKLVLGDTDWDGSHRKVIGSYADAAVREGHLALRPYESIVYRP